MKRLVPIVVLALMIFSLCGCGLFYSAYDSVLPDKLTRGTIEDNVYTSAYAGVSFAALEGWAYATDEELAKLMDMSADALSDAGLEFSEEAMEKQTLYDMMAQNPLTGTNVLLLYENLALTGNTGISEEKYIEETIRQLAEAQVFEYEFSDITTEDLCGHTYQSVRADMVDYGASQYYYVRKVDKYMLCVIVSVFGGDNISDVLGCFSAYEAVTES